VLGIAKTARDEKMQARRKRTPEEQRHHDEMARLYRQHVLKEDPNVIPITSLRKPVKKTEEPAELTRV